jgi:threonine aldolase
MWGTIVAEIASMIVEFIRASKMDKKAAMEAIQSEIDKLSAVNERVRKMVEEAKAKEAGVVNRNKTFANEKTLVLPQPKAK